MELTDQEKFIAKLQCENDFLKKELNAIKEKCEEKTKHKKALANEGNLLLSGALIYHN